MSEDRVMELRLSTTIVYFDLRGIARSRRRRAETRTGAVIRRGACGQTARAA